MNLKRQKTSIKNRKYTGGKKDVTYFTKKLNEFGLKVPKYLANNNISQKQFNSLQNKLERNITSRQKEEEIYNNQTKKLDTQIKQQIKLFNERVSPEKEQEYNKLRQYNQIKKAYEKQNLERYDDYLK